MTQYKYDTELWGYTSNIEIIKSIRKENDTLYRILPRLHSIRKNLELLSSKDMSILDDYYRNHFGEYDDDFKKEIEIIKSNILDALEGYIKWDSDNDADILLWEESQIKDIVNWLNELDEQDKSPHIKKLCALIDDFNSTLKGIRNVLRSEEDYCFTNRSYACFTKGWDIDDLCYTSIEDVIDHLIEKIEDDERVISDCIDIYDDFIDALK